MRSTVIRHIRQAISLYRLHGAAAFRARVIARLRGLTGVSTAGRKAYFSVKEADDAMFDGVKGVDTAGVQRLTSLTIDSANARYGTSHIASLTFEFTEAMDLAEQGFTDPALATFVDLGSGKGRALLMAAERGYSAIIGVEFAAELDATARANIKDRPDRERFTLVHGDAVEYELPPGPVLLYLANPFERPLTKEVAHRAMASWRRQHRPIRVVYIYPVAADEWEAAGWRRIHSTPSSVIFEP